MQGNLMVKVVILGFDGLEYNLVERFKLENMKQTQYGKILIPKECYTETVDPRGERVYEPYTPFVWSAFLTGRLPHEVGINRATLQKWNSSLLQLLRVLSVKLRLHKIRGKGKLLEKFGFKRSSFSWKDYRCPTIFDYADKPKIINVPTISEEWGIKLEGKKFDEIIKAAWRRFYWVKKEALKAIEEDWDLFMVYTRLLDVIGELCYGKFMTLFKAYTSCNHFVGEVKERLDEKETIFLIVSDHGMERFGNTLFGKHSNYGFYSLNIKTEWKPRFIIDFFPKIIEWLKK